MSTEKYNFETSRGKNVILQIYLKSNLFTSTWLFILRISYNLNKNSEKHSNTNIFIPNLRRFVYFCLAIKYSPWQHLILIQLFSINLFSFSFSISYTNPHFFLNENNRKIKKLHWYYVGNVDFLFFLIANKI